MDKQTQKKAIEEYMERNEGAGYAAMLVLLLFFLTLSVGIGFIFGAGYGFLTAALLLLLEYILVVKKTRHDAIAEYEKKVD